MFTAIITGYRFLYLQLAALVGYGWAIVALSFICSALMLPLMRAVAGVVRREKEYEDVIDPQVAAIKAKYASDMDRHFHIQALYQRYGYSPLAPIKKVMPLFVQIPFLLLTYYMLKGTVQLSGVSFFFLKDLGQPDALVAGINLLPLIMTAVNILTVFATPGFSHKDWTQAIAISLLFLVLLYTAPSALLLYWTLNNTITFVRTLCEKKCAGAKLLVSRLNPRFYLCWLSDRSQKFWAKVILVIFLIAGFLMVTYIAWKPIREAAGTLVGQSIKGTYFGLVLLSLVYLYFTWREKRAYILLSLLFLSSVCFFSCPYFLNRFIPLAYKEIADSFLVKTQFMCLPALLAMFCIIQGFVGFHKVGFLKVLKENGHLLLLPMVLALHYSFSSEVFVLPLKSIVILSVYMVMPICLLTLLLCVAYGKWIAEDALFKIGVGVCVGIYLVPMISRETGFLGFDRNLPVRLLFLLTSSMILLMVKSRKLMLVFSSILFLSVIVNIASNHGADIMTVKGTNDRESVKSRLGRVIGDAHCVKSNNVYILVYDSYAHRSVMDGLYLQDHVIYDCLKRNGFKIYDAYSTGYHTLSSMSAYFTIGGVKGGSVKSTIAGDNIFCDFLREAGYKTHYLMCGYTMPNRGERMPGDSYFPRASKIKRPEHVLYPCIMRGTLTQSPNVFNDYSHRDWLNAYYDVVTNFTASGNFVYAHSPYPEHARWDPRYRKSDAEEQREYKARLKVANNEIIDNLDLIKGDSSAIVVIMSDHGSSMLVPEKEGKWDARHLADHFGVLLAVRWPRDYSPCLELSCAQNVMLEIMIYLSGDKSLARLVGQGVADAIPSPMNSPVGVVRQGVIQIGQDAGTPLFSAADKAFFKGR